jgi:hypothetical protein
MAKLEKLKRSTDPYLPGRTRMPFEIPAPPPEDKNKKKKVAKFRKGGMVKGQCRDYSKGGA